MKCNILKPGKSCTVEIFPSFTILIGRKPSNLLPYTIWLLSDAQCFDEKTMLEEVLFSGLKLAMTYPLWASLSAATRSQLSVHVFQSFNQPWALPFGWTLYPISSGVALGGANWLFTKDAVRCVVAGNSCWHSRFHSSAAKLENITHLFDISTGVEQSSCDLIPNILDELASKQRVSVSMSDPVIIWTIIIQSIHFSSDAVVVLVGEDVLPHLYRCFEWLHADLQNYLQRKLLANESDDGRLFVCRKLSQVPPNASLVIDTACALPADSDNVEKGYDPRVASSKLELVVETECALVEPNIEQRDVLFGRIKLRYGTAIEEGGKISVPSIGVEICPHELCTSVVCRTSNTELGELVHLIS